MRDGVRLSANIFLPAERGRVPAILVRTPYGKGADITPNYQAFVEHGYAVVVAGRARALRIRRRLRSAAPGSRRWRRHPELDRARSPGRTARSA